MIDTVVVVVCGVEKLQEKNMMMNSFDLGGCCLARYGAATSYFASKTEQIMSKYRPIAPKPVVQNTAGLPDAVQNQQPQPCPSSFRASARSRKRNWEAASASGAAVPSPPPPPPRPHKRAARGRAGAPDVHFDGGHNRLERSSAKSTVISPALRHSDTSEEAVSPRGEISDSAASKCFAYTAAPPFGYSSSSAASSSSFDSAFTQKSTGSLEKSTDAAFMERAAASASPSVNLSLRERKSPTQIAVASESMQPMTMVGGEPFASAVLDSSLLMVPEADRDDLVTLPLLPIAPYRRESSPSTSCISNLSSREGNRMQMLYNDERGHLIPELSLAGPKMIFAPSPAQVPAPLPDISFLEHIYSASCDPVIVTDDSHSRSHQQVIWYNHAYKRAAESPLGLGIPKPLATFSLHKHQPQPGLKLDNSSSRATLWGFVKKFTPAPQDKDMMDSPHSTKKAAMVIMPQALRPVGSTVLVECITDTNSQACPLCGSMEEIEEQLEADNCPALISDFNNRVRWANSAYKQMVGQPECSWLESPAAGNAHAAKVMRINGEIVLILQRFQLPQSATAFSCRVKIQWTNGGEKSSMTLPCDVTRSDGDSKDCFYAWKFDVQAALCL